MAAIGLSSIQSFVAQSGELLAEMAIWYAQTRCEQSFATERSFSLLPVTHEGYPERSEGVLNALYSTQAKLHTGSACVRCFISLRMTTGTDEGLLRLYDDQPKPSRALYGCHK